MVAVLKMIAYLMAPTMRRVDDVSVVVMMVFDGVWGWWPCGGGRHGCFVSEVVGRESGNSSGERGRSFD